MSALARLVRRRMAGDAGFTLAELLVTVVLLGMLGAVVGTTFAATSGSLQRSIWRQQNTRLAQTGMENVTKAVRAGSKIERSGGLSALPAFEDATATTMTVYTFLGPRPSRIRYSIDGQQRLIETRTQADAASVPPYWTFTGTSTSRTIIDRVVNSGTQPLFVYRNATGATFTPVVGDSASRDAIRAVDVRLVVQADAANRVRPAQVEQRVYLPNLGSIG